MAKSMECVVCGTKDLHLIHTCQLRGVFSQCAGTQAHVEVPPPVDEDSTAIMREDGDCDW